MLTNPYESLHDAGRRWIKTNFHTHAGVGIAGDCGELPLDDVVRAYAKAKYGALAISNHNRYLARDKTYDNISVLDAVEYSAHPHMLLVGASRYHDVPHREAVRLAQEEGAFVILCHPNWMRPQYWPWADMLALSGYTGIEVLNPVIYTLKGSGLALDAWDYLLSHGKLVYGFGNDDFHQWRDIERAFNMICAKSGSFEDIREAVETGCFYVSSGVALKDLRVEGNRIEVAAGFMAESYVHTFHYRLVGSGGAPLASHMGDSAVFDVPEDEPYVRVEVRAENGAMMLLQPFTQPALFGK